MLIHVLDDSERTDTTILCAQQLQPLFDSFGWCHDKVMESSCYGPYSPVEVGVMLPLLMMVKTESLHGVFIDGEEEPMSRDAA